MKCFSPFFRDFADENAMYGILPFPCGHCPACRAQQASVWKFRCELESLQWRDIAFVTLTYSNENLPENGTLVPSHLQLFLKRLRRKLDYKIKYFACGEYGTKRKRPHYHLILFGLKPCDYDKVFSSWHYADLDKYKRGIDVQVALPASLGYVAGYVAKKTKASFYNVCPPFHRCSQGLGLKTYIDLCSQKGAFSTYLPDFKDKLRYVGRYLRNKGAAKFHMLEAVKEIGMQDLELEMHKIRTAVKPCLDKALEKYKSSNPHIGMRKAYASWHWYFEGSRLDFLAKQKLLRQRKDL